MLSTVEGMLSKEPVPVISFTSVGREAEVARRTLYLHWESVAHLLADAALFAEPPVAVFAAGLPLADRLRGFLEEYREYMDRPAIKNSISLLFAEATREIVATEALEKLLKHQFEQFTERVGIVTRDEFVHLVGPVALSGIATRRPASDELIASIVAGGVILIKAP